MPVRVDRTEAIQKALANVYLSLYKEIKKDPDYPLIPLLLRQKYSRKVYDATRKAISQVFGEGHNYVSRALNVETYQSDSDTILIKRETDKSVNLFWTRLDADAGREREIQSAQSRLIITEQKDEFDTEFYLENAAMIATTGALAISTLSKTKQLVDDPELPTEKPKIIWRAQQDEKTCLRLPDGSPGCAFLDGQEYEIDDPDIRVPGRMGPNATHANCRCYLELE
jgi:hypothetical protein